MEIFDVCDEYGLPVGETVTRAEAHEKGIRHRTAHVWIVRVKDGKYQELTKQLTSWKE